MLCDVEICAVFSPVSRMIPVSSVRAQISELSLVGFVVGSTWNRIKGTRDVGFFILSHKRDYRSFPDCIFFSTLFRLCQ